MYLREDGTPYYVGKGSKKRAYSFSKHSVHRPRTKESVLFTPCASNEESLECEKILICFYGRKDIGTGCLRNLTDGGEGTIGYVQTSEHIEKRVQIQRGRPSVQGRKNAESGLLNRIRTSESTSKGGRTISEKKSAHLRQLSEYLRGKPRPFAVREKLLAGLIAAHKKYPGKLWRNRGISK